MADENMSGFVTGITMPVDGGFMAYSGIYLSISFKKTNDKFQNFIYNKSGKVSMEITSNQSYSTGQCSKSEKSKGKRRVFLDFRIHNRIRNTSVCGKVSIIILPVVKILEVCEREGERMYKRLSYDLTEQAPGWPGNPTIKVEPYGLISEGKNCNEFRMMLFNHFGSHMDGPRHFNDEGPRLGELPLERFIFERPLLLDIPKTYKEMVTVEDLQAYEEQIKKADLLMIRSGFSSQRTENPLGYAVEGPAIHSEACKYMMDYFPNLKAVAMDWISLASYSHQGDGVLAHQYLLGKYHDHYICIIEDLNFSGLQADTIQKVFSVPLFVQGIDSAPVTVLAEISEKR